MPRDNINAQLDPQYRSKIGRNLFIVTTLVAVLVIGAWFGRHHYFRARNDRLMKQAREYAEASDYQNAWIVIRQVQRAEPNRIDAIQFAAVVGLSARAETG